MKYFRSIITFVFTVLFLPLFAVACQSRRKESVNWYIVIVINIVITNHTTIDNTIPCSLQGGVVNAMIDVCKSRYSHTVTP